MPDDGCSPRSNANIEPIEIQEEMERSFLDYAMSVITVAGAARRARRPEAGAPPDPLRHVRRRRRGPTAHRSARRGHRRRDGQVPPARRRRDLRRARPHGPGLLAAPPAGRRPRQLRLARPRRPAGGRATPSAGWRRSRCSCSARSTRTPSTSATTTTARPASRSCCRPGSRTCWSTAARGIAVGMATNIPPHNLGEVIDATSTSSTTPTPRPTTSCSSCKGPDFPTGALILGRGGHPRRLPHRPRLDPHARRSPRSRRRQRRRRASSSPSAVPDVGRGDRRRRSPSWSNDREIEGIRDVRNESAGRHDAPRHRAQARRATRSVVLNNLYKHTPLQTNFAVNMVALVDGVPRTLNLRAGAAGLRRPPGRGHHAAASEFRLQQGRRTGRTSSRACSRRST